MAMQIISVNQRQFIVNTGTKLTLPGKLAAVGDTILAQVLLDNHDGQVSIGTPYLSQTTALTVTGLVQSPKIRVATYKAKSRYRKVTGHRQWQTLLAVIAPAATKSQPPAKKSVSKAK